MDHLLTFGPSLLAAEGETSTYAPVVRLWFYILLLVVIVGALMSYAKKGLNQKVFKTTWKTPFEATLWTSLFEQLYLFIENMCVGAIGPHGRKYIPMIFTFWVVIFAGNIMALFMPFSPTASLSFNLGMALISIVYVQYEGIRANGFGTHVSHFSGPKMSGPMVIISAMIFVIEIISELMKNLSLSLRLYGNIHGGHVAVESMNKLGASLFIPIGEFLLPLKLLTCVVQALIFSMLTCVYLALVTHHESDHGDHDDAMAHNHALATGH